MTSPTLILDILAIDSSQSFSQTKFIIYAIVFVGMIIFFIKKSRDKSNLGINLKRVYCPSCGTKQAFIRKPKNSRQAMYGGSTCPKCNTEMDKYGQMIESEN